MRGARDGSGGRARRWVKDDPFGRLVRAVSRRPVLTLAVVAVLSIAAGVLALRLEPSTDVDTLVSRSSDSFKATEEAKRAFGDDAVIILVEGDLQRSLLTPDLARLNDLENCIAGQLPPDRLPTLPPESRSACDELAANRPVKVVYGPGNFISRSAAEINSAFQQSLAQKDATAEQNAEAARKLAARQGLPKPRQEQLADSARQLVEGEFRQQLIQRALRYELTRPPEINDPSFVSQLVFDTSQGANVPKARLSYLFPSPNAALIQARLRPDLSESERDRTIGLIKTVAGQERFEPQRGARLVVTGVPVVIDSLAAAVEHSLLILLVAAVVVMAGTLALVFRSRLRLLPLALALAAAALTFGGVSLAGGGLTMASIAALPVLIGLAVDYAIQFQSRFNEVRSIGRQPPSPKVAAPAAAAAGAPTIAAAGLATAVGFLVTLMSPVPMVRGFGLILVLGVAVALGCALTAGFAALVRFSDRGPRPEDVPPALPRARATVAGARRAATSRLTRLPFADRRVLALRRAREDASHAKAAMRDGARHSLALAVSEPRKVLAVALALAALGWALDTQTEVVSDVQELVPQDQQALQDLDTLQRATGVSGELDVTVRADDLTDPAVLAWMSDFQRDVLADHGYTTGERCSDAEDAPELCPALSLPDIVGAQGAAGQEQVRAVLDAVPPYFQQAVVSPDRKVANLAFGIRLMPLDRQKEVIDDIKDRLDPPPGVEASLTGLPVLAAEGNAALASPLRRLAMLVAGLALVFLVLLAVRRSVRLAAVPLIPIALATGWAALLLFMLRIPLNPMSAALGALVIAISTEFSVLLSARYREERLAGASPAQAIQLAYGSTGAAVLASGITATAGFAVLMASPIRMLRDFGAVTVVGLGVSLIGVMLVLPAALVWAEEHGRFSLRDLDPRPALRGLGGRLRGLDPGVVRRRLTSLGKPRLSRPGWSRLRRPRSRA